MTNYVYFIRPVGATGPIKIGCSFVPLRRLEDFAVWSPMPLEIIGAVPGTFQDERFLHECFADHHSHREWFHASERLLATVSDILAAGSVAPAREKLTPIGSVRGGKGRPRTDDQRQRHSRALRLAAIHRKRYSMGIRISDPPEVSAIMDRWRGWSYRKIPGIIPTDAELAIVDAYLLSAKAKLAEVPVAASRQFRDHAGAMA